MFKTSQSCTRWIHPTVETLDARSVTALRNVVHGSWLKDGDLLAGADVIDLIHETQRGDDVQGLTRDGMKFSYQLKTVFLLPKNRSISHATPDGA